MPAHGATSRGWLSSRGRLLGRVGIGVLTWVVAPDLVDEAVGDGAAREARLRALPSRLGVYFVLGLCLFSHEGYGQVLRDMTAGLTQVLAAAGWQVPATTALTGVRRRVGEQPLRWLSGRLAPALSPGRSRWSHVCGLLAVAWDGTAVDAADSAENTAAFGKPGGGRKRRGQPGGQAAPAAYPQLRLVVLIACGTRALLDAASGPVRGTGTGERALARQLLGRLRAGMLLIADRGFYSYGLRAAAAGTGAHLLWRARGNMRLPVARALPDGSWLARINDPRAVRRREHKNGQRRRRGSSLPAESGPLPGITVRVIEFVVTVTTEDGGARRERYRLITTLLDHRAYPAAELAAGYAWRWAIETGFREFKTYLRGPGRVLRARTPDLARQELWAYLVIYQAIRILIARAAAGAALDPDRISFTATLLAARRTIAAARDDMPAALQATEAEILSCLLPQRDGRVCVRAVKQTMTPYPRRQDNRPVSQHAEHTITITHPGATTRMSTDQAKQLTDRPDNPP